MKTINLILILLIFSFSALATNPEIESTESAEIIKTEINNPVLDLYNEQSDILKEEPKKIKIIIMNEDFRKVREEVIDSMEEINSRSTLVPVIYRSELITSIDNVSYYMLK